MTTIDRSKAAQFGRETLDILKAGRYRNLKGEHVWIANLLQHAVDNTCSYPPDERVPGADPGLRVTKYEVENETTLASVRRLVGAGYRVAALNFASAKHPGGGFLSGARAQEESLARASGLYRTLVNNPMYTYHQALGDAMYSNYAIYSPDVPVIRDDEGTLLEQPYLCSFITSPAVNAKALRGRHTHRQSEIREAMRERTDKVLQVAAHHGHEALVLGAWGCGVFGNDCAEIAELFRAALIETFAGQFSQVVFAVLDWSADQHFIGPFRRAFPSHAGSVG